MDEIANGSESTTLVQDFQSGENVILSGNWITGYDENGETMMAPITLDEISITRVGSDLVLAALVHSDYGTPGSTMRLEGFFSSGLSSVRIDGVVNDVSSL